MEFKQSMPIITSLRNPSLKQRHWDEIERMIGKSIVKDKTFTLGNLLEMKVRFIFAFKHFVCIMSQHRWVDICIEYLIFWQLFLVHVAKGNVRFCHHLAYIVHQCLHFRLLLWNHKARWNQTWQKASMEVPLQSFLFCPYHITNMATTGSLGFRLADS